LPHTGQACVDRNSFERFQHRRLLAAIERFGLDRFEPRDELRLLVAQAVARERRIGLRARIFERLDPRLRRLLRCNALLELAIACFELVDALGELADFGKQRGIVSERRKRRDCARRCDRERRRTDVANRCSRVHSVNRP